MTGILIVLICFVLLGIIVASLILFNRPPRPKESVVIEVPKDFESLVQTLEVDPASVKRPTPKEIEEEKRRSEEHEQGKFENQLEALKSPDFNVRCKAARALGERKHPRSIRPLIEALNDGNPHVIQEAAWALGEMREPTAVGPLVAALRVDYEDQVQWALVRIGKPAVEQLVPMLDNESEEIRERAERALRTIQEPFSVSSLIFRMKMGDHDERRDAIWGLRDALRRNPRAEALDPLLRAMADDDQELRIKAIEAIGLLKNPQAVTPLIDALQDHQLRNAAARALGEIGDTRAVPPLIIALRDKDQRIRESAAVALGHIGAAAVEPLTAALRDDSRDIRENAAWALGETRDPKAVQPLIGALHDADMLVRVKAAEALGQIGSGSGIDALMNALSDANLLVRVKAAESLGRIGHPDAVKPLVNALKDSNLYVREQALEALGALKDKRAVTGIMDALQDLHIEIVSRTLNDITGANLSTVDQWKEWWEDNRTKYRVRHRLT